VFYRDIANCTPSRRLPVRRRHLDLVVAGDGETDQRRRVHREDDE
jgi:hypothetical protein